jgi:hypothetical protein
MDKQQTPEQPNQPWRNDYNPFSKAQLRDLKSGAMVHAPEREAARAKFAEEAFGKSKEDRDFLTTATDVSRDSATIQQIMSPLLAAIKQWDGSTVGMRKLLPLLDEINRFAQKDPTLTDKEKRHLDQRCKELASYIHAKTALFTRIKDSVRSVIRDKREEYGETLAKDYGMLGRLASKVMRVENPEQKALRHARSEALSALAGHPRADEVEDNAKADAEAPVKKGKKVVKESSSPVNEPAGNVLTKILVTDESILSELHQQTGLLRDGLEADFQGKEDKERRSIEGTKQSKVERVSSGKGKEVLPKGWWTRRWQAWVTLSRDLAGCSSG